MIETAVRLISEKGVDRCRFLLSLRASGLNRTTGNTISTAETRCSQPLKSGLQLELARRSAAHPAARTYRLHHSFFVLENQS